MITAITMISCQVNAIPEAAAAIAEIPGVDSVYSVTGDVDLIAILKLAQHDDLANIVTDGIARINGVEALSTHLAFREYASAQLEEAFHLGLD